MAVPVQQSLVGSPAYRVWGNNHKHNHARFDPRGNVISKGHACVERLSFDQS